MTSFMIAAPSSGAGKTLVTLGLLKAFADSGVKTRSAKAGPDYIDPAFHAAATGDACINLDPWAMRAEHIQTLASEFREGSDVFIVEGMMGLFDGAADGSGAAADLAIALAMPVVLVVDVSSMSFSVAAVVKGFRDHNTSLNFAGVILNKVGSPRHETMLRNALNAEDITVLGAVPKNGALELPSRHLGLVQAGEHEKLESFIGQAAVHISKHCNLAELAKLNSQTSEPCNAVGLPPLGQRIAIARDEAFTFCYPHLLRYWQKIGVELSFFSPLADEAPRFDSDAVFLPGGYPELHASKLSAATCFKSGLTEAANRGSLIYGECGGYMVLGKSIVDVDGRSHAMAGLLNLQTSFEKRKLHLGYRQIKARNFKLGDRLRGHEFHYTSALVEQGTPLFEAWDAVETSLGNVGLRHGNVMGSYLHVIDRAA